MKTKILSIVIISLFLGTTIIPAITSSSINNKITSLDENSQCYGFIIPIVKLENESNANDINCRIYHMVNDFLREKITVYWSAQNFSKSITKINSSEEENMFFEKGTFIIPFMENETIDTKIITIVCDYNQSNEIENNTTIIPVYQLMKSLEIDAFKLTKVKIARYHGSRTLDIQYLLDLNLIETGFLDFDIITPENIKSKLKKENFNVMFWPGGSGDLGNINWRKASIEEIIHGVRGSIRNFLNNGGSYFGCCYGSLKASSFSRYNIYKLCYFPLLKLINVFTYLHDNGKHVLCTQKIKNLNHPVTYSLNSTITDFYGGGPRITYVGRNVEVLSEINNAHENVDKTPSWATSDFGKGKVVIFTSHPEIVDYFDGYYHGKRVIANTLFYTTAKVSENYYCLSKTKSIDDINIILQNTSDIQIEKNVENTLFNKVRENISSYIISTISYRNNLSNILELIKNNFEDGEKEYFVKYHNRYINRIYININKTFDIIEKINLSFNKVEQIYEFISQNQNIQNEIVSLNNYSNLKLRDIDKSLSEIKVRIDNVKRKTNSLINNYVIFKDIIRDYIKKDIYEISKTSSLIYVYTTQIYFEILKFLRSNWYEFETNYFLEESGD